MVSRMDKTERSSLVPRPLKTWEWPGDEAKRGERLTPV